MLFAWLDWKMNKWLKVSFRLKNALARGDNIPTKMHFCIEKNYNIWHPHAAAASLKPRAQQWNKSAFTAHELEIRFEALALDLGFLLTFLELADQGLCFRRLRWF